MKVFPWYQVQQAGPAAELHRSATRHAVILTVTTKTVEGGGARHSGPPRFPGICVRSGRRIPFVRPFCRSEKIMSPPETEPAPEPPPEKWAVLLIHGVGDTTPGALLTAVGGAMVAAKPGLVLPAGHMVLTLPDGPPGPTGVPPTFPVHTQTGTRGT